MNLLWLKAEPLSFPLKLLEERPAAAAEHILRLEASAHANCRSTPWRPDRVLTETSTCYMTKRTWRRTRILTAVPQSIAVLPRVRLRCTAALTLEVWKMTTLTFIQNTRHMFRAAFPWLLMLLMLLRQATPPPKNEDKEKGRGLNLSHATDPEKH